MGIPVVRLAKGALGAVGVARTSISTVSMIDKVRELKTNQNSNIAEKASAAWDAFQDLVTELAKSSMTLPGWTPPGEASTAVTATVSNSAPGWFSWSLIGNVLSCGVVVCGAFFLFKLRLNRKALDESIVSSIHDTADKIGLPHPLIEKKLSFLRTNQELVDFNLQLNRDLIIKEVHITDLSIAAAASKATGLVTIPNIIMAVAGVGFLYLLFRTRRSVAAALRLEVKRFLREPQDG